MIKNKAREIGANILTKISYPITGNASNYLKEEWELANDYFKSKIATNTSIATNLAIYSALCGLI